MQNEQLAMENYHFSGGFLVLIEPRQGVANFAICID